MVAHRRQNLVEWPEQSLHQIRFGAIRRNRRLANRVLDAPQLTSTNQSDITYNSPLSNFTNLTESTEPNDTPIPNLISYSSPPPSPDSIEIISSNDDSDSVQLIPDDPILSEESFEPIDPFEVYNFSEETDLDNILDFIDSETVVVDELCSYIDDPNIFPPELYIELQEILNNSEDLLQ